MPEPKWFYRSLNHRDMADLLGIELWGHTPHGDLRVAPKGEPQPTGAMTYAELEASFTARFKIVRHPKRSPLFQVVEKEAEPAFERFA